MNARGPTQVLSDVEADRKLHDLGYVVVDVLDGPSVSRLRDGWSELAATHQPVWDPTGMAATIRHPGLDWAAHEVILEEVAGPVAHLTRDRVCFMSTFLVKKPSANVLPAHLDWRLVDEPRELTHGCWIALQDMDAAVGPLGVAPGSHLLVDFDRTPDEPGHEWTTALIDAGADTQVLEIRAGQAIVFDHRLVHFSQPNHSASMRMAANLGLSTADRADLACERLLTYMERGMRGIGSDPQIPELVEAMPPTSGGGHRAEKPTDTPLRAESPHRRLLERLRPVRGARRETTWGS